MKRSNVIKAVILVVLLHGMPFDRGTEQLSARILTEDLIEGVTIGVGLGVAGFIGLKMLLSSYGNDFSYEVSVGKNSISVSKSDKKLNDFVGQDGVLRQAYDFIDEVVNFSTYKKLGAQRVKALCLDGVRGNGKKLLAYAIAGELDAYVLPVSAHWFVGGGYTLGETVIKIVFDYAKQIAGRRRVVLFIDNFEALNEDVLRNPLCYLNKGLVEEIARNVEDIEKNTDIVVIASTTLMQGIDGRLFKPGCFDRIINIPLPSEKGRQEVIAHYLKDALFCEEIDLQKHEVITYLVNETAGFTAGMLKKMLSQAAYLAGKDNGKQITEEHLRIACQCLKSQKQSIFHEDLTKGFYYTFSEDTKFCEVIGQDEVVKEAKEVIDFLQNPERYVALGARKPKGLLFYGPPGCGKTLLARAIAGEAKAGFIFVSGAEFIQIFAGTGPMTVRVLFDFARKMTREMPVIIFIDEIDSLGSRDNTDSSGAGMEHDSTINELLRQMDGFTQNENILVIAATNILQKLDSALLRPGRFDRKVFVPLPDRVGREELLLYYLNKRKMDQVSERESVAKNFAERTVGFSGADLENLVNEAAILATRYNAESVDSSHVDEAFEKIVLGLTSKVPMLAEGQKRVAYHEAGHALVALLNDIPLSKVSILPREKAAGVTWFLERNDSTKSMLLQRVMCLQGGFIAEETVFGEVSIGVYDDLAKASKIVNQMIRKCGFGEDKLQGVVQEAACSQEGNNLFDQEVRRMLHKTLARTRELINLHLDELHKLASCLLESETLSAEEVYEIVGIHSGAS